MARRTPEMSDPELTARARQLLKRYLPEIAPPASIQWSMRMKCSPRRAKWGVCSPSRRAIRISNVLKRVPSWVRDGVIIHELAHLKVPNHSAAFHALVNRYPLTAKKQQFLREYMRTIEPEAKEAGIRRRMPSKKVAARTQGKRSRPSKSLAVGSIVSFGCPQGQKTRGRIVRVAERSVIVETLESRGKTRAGMRWRVPHAFITATARRRS